MVKHLDRGQSRQMEIPSAEESPDCTEQGAPLKRGVLWTIFHGKTSATESRPPPGNGGKGERAG